MSFYRSKGFWIVFAILSPLLMIAANYGFKVMTSVFKKDLGNGVVIYADDYVKSGYWVFDCEYRRLISRKPLPTPISELEAVDRLIIGDMYYLKAADRDQAKSAIKALAGIEGWHKSLRYVYSGLNSHSNLNTHIFDVLGTCNDKVWVLKVRQWIDGKSVSSFEVTAEPYDPETYVDHAKALQAAAKSCPIPQ